MTRTMLQRWAPVVVLAAVCGLGLAGTMWSLIAIFVENRTAITATRERLIELTARRIDPAALSDQRSRLEAVSGREAGLLTISAEAGAIGRFETALRTMLQARGAQILSIRQAGPIGDENGARFVRAAVSLRILEDQTIPLLAMMETGTPTVFFEEVHLRRPDSTSRTDAAHLELTGTIRVYLELTGQQERKS